MSLAQIGEKIRKLRIHAGLPQSQLARLYGLSRATISQLENGTLNDLGLTKLVAVMEILGIEMKVSHSPSLTSALSVAARRISTSYRLVVTPDQLAWMLRSDLAPEEYQPHLMALLDETPVPVVLQAVEEVATSDVPAKKIIRHIRQLAKQWTVHRTI